MRTRIVTLLMAAAMLVGPMAIPSSAHDLGCANQGRETAHHAVPEGNPAHDDIPC
jgi:hypothetical protein